MDRRGLILGGAAVAAAAGAEALRPRRKLILLKSGKIDNLMPRNFGDWSAEASSGLVSPDQAGKLAKSLYSEIVERVYHRSHADGEVMLLAAYGDTQSDLLQLHRPESCYPAVGYNVESSRPARVPLPGGATIPARQVVASTTDRRENILYWTRIGEYLPQSASEQRQARLQNALHGDVADGILFRCSAVGDSEACFALMNAFVPALLEATPPAARPALVGTNIARHLV